MADDTQAVLSDLARAKALFQQRAILAVMNVRPTDLPTGDLDYVPIVGTIEPNGFVKWGGR